MEKEIAGILERDWRLIEESKALFWTERNLTPSAALGMADELRRYVQGIRPDWPDADDRDADLAMHIRISQALRHVANRTR